jgi:hypothetical protein
MGYVCRIICEVGTSKRDGLDLSWTTILLVWEWKRQDRRSQHTVFSQKPGICIYLFISSNLIINCTEWL